MSDILKFSMKLNTKLVQWENGKRDVGDVGNGNCNGNRYSCSLRLKLVCRCSVVYSLIESSLVSGVVASSQQ